jgi:hypothetical protein
LPSILQVCTCGLTVQGGERSRNEDVIQCKAIGCETVWVSVKVEWESVEVVDLTETTAVSPAMCRT